MDASAREKAIPQPGASAARGGTAPEAMPEAALRTKKLSVWYGDNQALHEVSLDMPRNKITAIIGPSGCGKSTMLRMLNRMNDFVVSLRSSGEVEFAGHNLYAPGVDPVAVRRRIGMVFQKPNPFPKSIYDNVAWGPRINRLASGANLDELVEKSLRGASLWEEVKDRLDTSGTTLSGGQQQRLCIARTLAMEPEIILMDEPCSALDPVSTGHIEDLIFELASDYTIVIVTHNMQQAARVSDYTAFLENGHLIEYGPTQQVFTKPVQKRTEEYVTGRFG